ncbi:DUF1345 domain-containing protein [Agromyces lapidis]|uniref:DUF1345 domain-containing protein n=1 Tax=Agromyces lapidis TaxID=279574 RepID=A0ABV5SL97_9MICO|nr:DUF1345 domain-containing protein [Agromyces lapidis]
MTKATTDERAYDAGAIIAESIGLAVQLCLVVLGVWFIVDEENVDALVAWCLIGTTYLVATMLVLNLAVRRPHLAGRRRTRRFLAHPVMRTVASVLMFSSSTVGVVAAIELIVLRNDPDWGPFIELFAVWAMLVAWCLFHWGWARIYYSRQHSAAGRAPLEFPRTPEPTLIDFVYFAFTNATNFSVSDVVVTTTRMRWSVVWHTTLSFFFNALIIVLAINTITGIQVDPALLD